MPESECRPADSRILRVRPVSDPSPVLDAATRQQLGSRLRALYDPVIDEALDPRLAELLRQLDTDRAAGARHATLQP